MTGALDRAAGWFEGRSPRERWLLVVGGAAVLAWIALTFVWQPMEARRDELHRQVALYERALVALQADPAPAAAAVPADGRALNAIVTEAAGGFDLTIRRIEPEGDRLRVSLDEALFDTVILWLEAMQRDSGLHVAELDMSRRPAPGVVDATLVLER
jgi:general secretion pathway protein M